MEESLTTKLSDFGLTVNQAKIYWSIVQSGATSVSRIAESTHLHRQDIYKILPKLEKMGLVVERIHVPIIIEAVPIEKALKNLISIERKKADERIFRLETKLKELVDANKEQQELKRTEEARFTLLTTDEQIRNITNLTFENTKEECNLVTNIDLLTRRMDHFREHFQKLSRRGAKVQVIVENFGHLDLVREILEKIKPGNSDFAAKFISKRRYIPYRIIDNKELLIRRKKITESGLPCILWTDGAAIVQFYKENFGNAWNSSQAISIYVPDHRERGSAEVQKAT